MSDFAQFLEQCTSGNVVPVVDTLPADLLTPLAVYLRIADGAKHSFLLESVAGGESLARYSFIGANPAAVVKSKRDEVTVVDSGEESTATGSIIEFLREHFGSQILADVPGLPSFVGGAIGYFGFNASGLFEPKLAKCFEGDDSEIAQFMMFRSIVAFDHAKQEIKLISLIFTDDAKSGGDLHTLFEAAMQVNRDVRERLEAPSFRIPAMKLDRPAGPATSNWERADFEEAVRKVKELIAAGECCQVVLSQCFTKPTNASPIGIYRAVRSLNPSPYMFLLNLDQRAVIGASPEMLVKCTGNRLEYRPIAGTRKRGVDAADDERLAEEMKNDEKEVSEHQMLVDLGRNDLGRIAKFSTVEVDSLMKVEKYSHVQHLVSSLSAKLAEGMDRFDALISCFPAGTVSGAPKIRAAETIAELEPTARGVYSGAVGYFDYSGNMDTCIAIRTMTLENGIAEVQAGAGIVADSVPSAEFDETVNKAAAMLRAIELAEGGGE